MARAGIEPATFRFSGGRSYQLSYLAIRPPAHPVKPNAPESLATLTGLEPATFAVTGRRANQLRHRALFLTVFLCVLFARERTLVDAMRITQIDPHPTPSTLVRHIFQAHLHARGRTLRGTRLRPLPRASTCEPCRGNAHAFAIGQMRNVPATTSVVTGTSIRVPPTGFEPALPA